MGGPKAGLEDAIREALISFPWKNHGIEIPDEEPIWANMLTVELTWAVRNRLDHVNTMIGELQDYVDQVL